MACVTPAKTVFASLHVSPGLSCPPYIIFIMQGLIKIEEGLFGVPGAVSPHSLGNLEHILVHLYASAEKNKSGRTLELCPVVKCFEIH